MSRQQYINKHLTKLLKKVETSIRQGEFEGIVTPADNLRVPALIFKVEFIDDYIKQLIGADKKSDTESDPGENPGDEPTKADKSVDGLDDA